MNTINLLFWVASIILVVMCLVSIVTENTKLKLPKGVRVPGVEVKLGLLVAVVLLFFVLKHQENFVAPLTSSKDVLPSTCQGYNGYKVDKETGNWVSENSKCEDSKYNNMDNAFSNTGFYKKCSQPNYLCDKDLLNKEKVIVNMPNSPQSVDVNMNYSSDEAPSVTCDKNDKDNRSKFMLSLNKVHPACCPSQFSTSRGCVCMNDNQLNCLTNRGSSEENGNN